MSDNARDCFKVINTQGVHLRPAQMIATLSSSYSDCEVHATKDGTRVNAKSIMGITELIGSCGSEIEFEIIGPSADKCLERLRELFARGFGEDIDPQFADSFKA